MAVVLAVMTSTRRELLRTAPLGVLATLTPAVHAVTAFEQQQSAWASSWQRSMRYFDEVVAAMPDDGLRFRPMPEVRSFAEQVWHVAVAVEGFAALAAPGGPPAGPSAMPATMTLAALRERLRTGLQAGRSAINRLTAERMADTVPWSGRGYEAVTRMPIAGVIQVMHDHTTHHRGQCIVYLRLRGVVPPAYVD